MNEIVRKLASVRKIDAITPIENADAIECAHIGGWKVVVKKGEFSPGDLAIYFEIDSWVPTTIAPFLSKGREPRIYNNVRGERLRTIKLRGQISQGLLLPLDFYEDESGNKEYMITDISSLEDEGYIENFIKVQEGDDVTEFLGIQKWEAAISAQLRGLVRGSFPSFLRKTDQERVQNLNKEITKHKQEMFEVTIKLDGTSFTAYYNNGDIGCCSRNQLMKHDDDDNKDNLYVRIFHDSGLSTVLPLIGRNIAIQGEIMGPGVQGNRETLKDTQLFVFDVFNIDEQRYMNADERNNLMNELIAYGINQFKVLHVPVLEYRTLKDIDTVDSILQYAEGPSINHPIREGVVFKSIESDFTFKAISNKFLLNEE